MFHGIYQIQINPSIKPKILQILQGKIIVILLLISHRTKYQLYNFRFMSTVNFGSESFTKNTQDLNIFIMNDKTRVFELQEIYSKRHSKDQSLWAIDISDQSQSIIDILNQLENLTATFDDEILFFKSINTSYIEVFEVYKLSYKSKFGIGNQGFWSENLGLSMREEENRYTRLRDLGGLHLKMATKVSQPYISKMTPLENGKGYKMEGMLSDIFDNLQVKFKD